MDQGKRTYFAVTIIHRRVRCLVGMSLGSVCGALRVRLDVAQGWLLAYLNDSLSEGVIGN